MYSLVKDARRGGNPVGFILVLSAACRWQSLLAQTERRAAPSLFRTGRTRRDNNRSPKLPPPGSQALGTSAHHIYTKTRTRKLAGQAPRYIHLTELLAVKSNLIYSSRYRCTRCMYPPAVKLKGPLFTPYTRVYRINRVVQIVSVRNLGAALFSFLPET